jgi:hypothetical protein
MRLAPGQVGRAVAGPQVQRHAGVAAAETGEVGVSHR